MVTVIKDLKKRISSNKEALNENCKQLIDAMCPILNSIIENENSMNEETIKEWYDANQKSIEIIDEALQRLKQQYRLK